MIGPILLALVLAPADAPVPPDAAAWVARLGSASFDERVEACKALEALGGPALPALRAGAEGPDDRIRARALDLIPIIGRQVEADRFARPTPVRLDFRDRALGQVIDDLDVRQGLGLALRFGPEPNRRMMGLDRADPGRLEALEARKVTLEDPHPVPYWEAIDRLCRAGGLRYGVSAGRRSGWGWPPLVLMGDRTGRGPASDYGPYRVQAIVAADLQDDDPFGRGSGGRREQPAGPGRRSVPLALLAEPGLTLYQEGPVSVTDAIDDRGRSVKPAAAPAAEAEADPPNGPRLGGPPDAPIRAFAMLEAPDPPSLRLRRLRGTVPVIAVAWDLEPIVIPLGDPSALGRPYPTRDTVVSVDEFATDPNGRTIVRVTFRFDGGNLARGRRFEPGRADFTSFDRDRILDRIELRDAAGRSIRHGGGGQTRGADGRGFYDSYPITVPPYQDRAMHAGPARIPAELRYHGYVQRAISIPFDLQDIPLP